MFTLDEIIQQIEETTFYQRVLNGDLTSKQYLTYLAQFQPLYNHMERYPLPYESMRRDARAMVDITEITNLPENVFDTITPPFPITFEYMQYILTLDEEETKPHAYVHYMLLMKNCEIIKSNLSAGTGRLYDFSNIEACIDSLSNFKNSVTLDASDAIRHYTIQILDELQRIS